MAFRRGLSVCKQHARSRRSLRLFAVIIICSSLYTIHFLILPNVSGYYNNDCLLQPEQLDDLRYLVKHVTMAYEELNQTYWLDFGTLLGFTRSGDVLPHDGDVDISRIAMVPRHLEVSFDNKLKGIFKRYKIIGNARIAKYKSGSADLFRWTSMENNSHVLTEYFPPGMKFTFGDKLSSPFISRTLPRNVVLPTKSGNFLGQVVQIPQRPQALLNIRYYLPWSITLPYKWKCYFKF